MLYVFDDRLFRNIVDSISLSRLIISRRESCVLDAILRTSVPQNFNLQARRCSHVQQSSRSFARPREGSRAAIRLAWAPTNLYPVEATPFYWQEILLARHLGHRIRWTSVDVANIECLAWKIPRSHFFRWETIALRERKGERERNRSFSHPKSFWNLKFLVLFNFHQTTSCKLVTKVIRSWKSGGKKESKLTDFGGGSVRFTWEMRQRATARSFTVGWFVTGEMVSSSVHRGRACTRR